MWNPAPPGNAGRQNQAINFGNSAGSRPGFSLKFKPRTTWISPKHAFFIFYSSWVMTSWHLTWLRWDAWQGSLNIVNTWFLCERICLCAFVPVHTFKCKSTCKRMCLSLSRIWVCCKQNFVSISSGKWLFNHCLPHHTVVFFCLCVSSRTSAWRRSACRLLLLPPPAASR